MRHTRMGELSKRSRRAGATQRCLRHQTLAAAVAEALESRQLLANIIYVDDTATGANNGSSWTNAYTDLQTALAIAVPGQEIRVGQGSYKPTTSTDRTVAFYLQNGVRVIGSYAGYGALDPDLRDPVGYPSILSGDIGSPGVSDDNTYHVVIGSGTDSTAVLDGFLITSGNANLAESLDDSGGGMYISHGSPTVVNCTFSGNAASSSGGALFALGATSRFDNCTFSGNTAVWGGAASTNTSPVAFTRCTFRNNAALRYGGGLRAEGSSGGSGGPTLRECTFEANTAEDAGGAQLSSSGSTLVDCIFTGNLATGYSVSGGGVYVTSPASLTNCTFHANIARGEVGGYGGGIYNSYAPTVLNNCVFVGNTATNADGSYGSGGGIFNSHSSPVINNCTFTANRAAFGGAIHNANSSALSIRNSILWGDIARVSPEIHDYQSTSTVTYSNLQGGLDGAGNINADPLFARDAVPGPDGTWGTMDDDFGNLQVHFPSPCIDAGNNAAVPSSVTTDAAGHPRIIEGVVDIGAFERSDGNSVISGSVWNDRDGYGSRNTGEEGFGAVVVSLYADNGDAVFAPAAGGDLLLTSRMTAADGTYRVSDLAPGQYWVIVDRSVPVIDGYELTTASDHLLVSLDAGLELDNTSFGFLRPIMVTTAADVVNASDGVLSLREAIHSANAEPTYSTIFFDAALAGQTIQLAAAGSQLIIGTHTRLSGLGSGALSIDSGGEKPVLYIGSGVSADIGRLTLAHGSAYVGGGLYLDSNANVTAKDLSIQSCSASLRGGGVFVGYGGQLTMSDSFIGDSTAGHQGGGIFADFLTQVTLNRVAVSQNHAVNGGGGIFADGTVVATNVTVSGNRSDRSGGGVHGDFGQFTFVNATIANNVADANRDGVGTGGGLFTQTTAPMLANTVVAGNTAGGTTPNDVVGAVAAGSSHNLIGTGAPGLTHGVSGNLLGTSASPFDPRLMPLGLYGGALPYHPLRYDSAAIEAGSNALAQSANLTTDQPGSPRYRDFDGDGEAVIDIGAFEASRLLIVDSLLDESVDTDSKLSLREALALAGTRPGLDLIRFDAGLAVEGQIVAPVTQGELVVDSQVDVHGLAGVKVVLDAGGSLRVLHIAVGGHAMVSDLAIVHGAAASGAGILNEGVLELRGVLLSGNAASGDGAGLWSSGTLLALNTTFSGNSANGSGGGVMVAGGTASFTNVTLTLNVCDADGNVTGAGGGIAVSGGAIVTLANTIAAQNQRGSGSPDDAAGSFDAASLYNFIGVIEGCTGLAGAGSQYGSLASPADARLTVLGDHGGPTLTHGVLPASPVVDSGSDAIASAAGLLVDARGLERRRDGDDDGIARIDRGAFEQQIPLNRSPVFTSVQTIRGGVEERPLSLRFDQLLAASDAADPDGNAMSFRIEGMLSGSLSIGGTAVVPGSTLLATGQALTWTPPALDFGTSKTLVVPAFSVAAFDGQVASSTSVQVSIEVTTTAEPVNYAVLFSGGDRVELNYALYYQNLKRIYQVLTSQYGLKPSDISIVYADGRDPAPDQKGGHNSDMSFAANVLPATRANLRSTLVDLSRKVDANDHLFVWTFDHGLGSPAQPSVIGEEVVKGWGAGQEIGDEELAVWLQGLQAGQVASDFGVPEGYSGIQPGFSTYVFGQCFAGGMLDNLSTGQTTFGAAAANHYEASYADYFIGAFAEALERGYNTTGSAFAYAFDKDGRSRDSGVANGGAWTFNTEHPWSAGGDFAIFATSRALNANVEIRSATPLKIASGANELEITFDQLKAALEVIDPTNQSPAFRITGVDLGQIWRDGSIVNVAGEIDRATLSYEDTSLIWKRPTGTSGVLSALRVRAVAADGSVSNEMLLPIRIGEATSGAIARADTQALQGSSSDVLITLLTNDSGSGLKVLRLGQPLHGSLSLDPVTSQVRYTPAAEFLGADRFSYVIADSSGNSDLATVSLQVLSYDPSQQVSLTNRYSLTELPPPPGWAELPSSWDWSYRQSLPAWTSTRAVDINDEGVVLVSTSRPNQTDGSLNYVGSTNASYRWVAGNGEPYWNASASGSITANNTLLLLLQAIHPVTGQPMLSPAGREIFDGIDAFSVSNTSITPHLRYLDPDNANEAGFPSVGGLWYDVGTQGQLWELTDGLTPVDVTSEQLNTPSYWMVGNNTLSFRAELWSIDEGSQMQLASIAGTGGSQRSEARAISDAGIVAGLLEYASSHYYGFTYEHNGYGTRMLLPTGSFSDSAALAISDLGVAVGFSGTYGRDEHSGLATLWDASGNATALGTLGGTGWSVAYDVSDAGLIVGASNGHAVLWSGGAVHDLNALVDGLPAGLVLFEARGINAAGQIVATGTINGQMRAYFLDLASAIEAVNDSAQTSSRKPISFNVLNNDRGARTLSSVSTTGLAGQLLSWTADGQVTFDPAGAFNDLQPGQARTTSFTYTARDALGGVDTATVQISVQALSTFHVTSFSTTSSGAIVSFSHALDLTQLDLYDGADAAAEVPDLSLVGASSGAVRGSIIAQGNTLEFIATGGPLGIDSYTLTLRGQADGFTSPTLGALDGDADDTAGGDYLRSFSVSATPRTLSLPDFARGPGQNLGTPANPAGGLPVTLSDATGLLAAHLVLRYDPSLLSITGVRSAIPGWSLTPNISTPGIVDVALYGLSALPAGARTLLYLDGNVPDTAPCGAAQVLYFEQISLNEGELPSLPDRAVHKVLFPGDANGNGAYSAMDASLITRVSVNLDSGFDAAELIDPRIIADVTGDGTVSPMDASAIARASIFIPIATLPALPANFPTTFFTGPDPVITAPELALLPGASSTSAFTIDQSAGLQGLNLSLRYNTGQLQLTDSDIAPGSLLSSAGWPAFANIVGDRLYIASYGLDPLPAGSGDLLSLTTNAQSTAAPGTSTLDLEGQLNDGGLTLTAIDGSLYVPITGDITLDGILDADDYFAIDAGFITQGSPGTSNRALAWSLGDLNFDSRIDIDDYFLIDSAYAKQPGPLVAQSASAAVPAPRAAPVAPATAPDLFGQVAISSEDLDLVPAEVF